MGDAKIGERSFLSWEGVLGGEEGAEVVGVCAFMYTLVYSERAK